jgi:hypothetical protein
MKQSYEVEIKETLRMTVRVEAGDAEQAEEMVQAAYKKGDYIMDAEHFDGVEFNTREVNTRNKNHRQCGQER